MYQQRQSHTGVYPITRQLPQIIIRGETCNSMAYARQDWHCCWVLLPGGRNGRKSYLPDFIWTSGLHRKTKRQKLKCISCWRCGFYMVELKGFEPSTSALRTYNTPVHKSSCENSLDDTPNSPSPLASPQNTGEVPAHIKEIVALIDGLTEQERVLLLAVLIRKA